MRRVQSLIIDGRRSWATNSCADNMSGTSEVPQLADPLCATSKSAEVVIPASRRSGFCHLTLVLGHPILNSNPHAFRLQPDALGDAMDAGRQCLKTELFVQAIPLSN